MSLPRSGTIDLLRAKRVELMLKWLWKLIAKRIEDGLLAEMCADMEELYTSMVNLEEDMIEVYSLLEENKGELSLLRAELWEQIDGVLEPLSKRIGQRVRRAEQTDTKDISSTLPRGLLTEEKLKEHGINLKNWKDKRGNQESSK